MTKGASPTTTGQSVVVLRVSDVTGQSVKRFSAANKNFPSFLIPRVFTLLVVLNHPRVESIISKAIDERAKASHLIDLLDQSLLAKAFRGELVPQDPNDEPAFVLLERVRANCDGQRESCADADAGPRLRNLP